MKIRNGFVSNSSSSSYVVLGFASNDGDMDLPKGYDILYVENNDVDYLIGLVLADDEYLDNNVISNLCDKIKKMSEDFNINESEIKLFAGTRQC